MSPLPSFRVYAPVRRFSSTVKCSKQWRPSITWITPLLTSSFGLSASTLSPATSIDPLVTSPLSALNKFEQIHNLEQIVEEEEKWFDYGLQKLRNNIYFPGFFIIFGERINESNIL